MIDVMEFLSKEILGASATIIGFVGVAIYITSILRGQTKPHFYTHFVWFILSAIALSGQFHDKAGPGAWASTLTTLACLTTALLALKWGEKNITRGDKIALFASLAAIVPWLLMKDPLVSVIMVTTIELVAFYPTVRKSWHKPQQENMTAYALGSAKLGLSLLALENVTWNTALYPGVNFFLNTAFIVMCLVRRRTLY